MFDMGSLVRRIEALEKNRGASLRYAKVSSVQEKDGTVRVVLEDGEDMVTHPLQVLVPRSGKDVQQDMPDVGDRVAVLFAGQGFESGVVLGSYYSAANPAPGKNSDVEYRRFSDGTELSYDRASHKLSASVQGDVELTATGTVKASAQGVLEVQSSSNILIKAPAIVLNGAISSAGYDGAPGTFKMVGEVEVEGRMDSSDDVTAGGISLMAHTHTCPDGQTSGPQ